MTLPQVSGMDILQFIRLLGELRAAGLTSAQYIDIQTSTELEPAQVNALLEQADSLYEWIKDKLAEGCLLLHPGQTASDSQLASVCQGGDLLQAIVFPDASELELDSDSFTRNERFEQLIMGNSGSLGGQHGLYAEPLLSSIPYFVEADIAEFTCERLLKLREDEQT